MPEKKTALVTGATKGIGRAIAERLLREGYAVLGNYARDEEAAENFLKENGAYLDAVALVKKDLSSYAAASELADEAKARFGKLDVLVCNSGTTDPTPFGQIAPESWNRVMDVNLHAPLYLTKQCVPLLQGEKGSVIFIGSILGGGGYPHARSVSYGVSKAALEALAEELAWELRPLGITVNCIAPGFTETPWQAGKAPDHRKRIEDKIALHRFAKPEEIADICYALICSPRITGKTVPVDGGYCCE